MPATIFVVPSFVGARTFWWDRLALRGELDNQARNRVLHELGGIDAEVVTRIEDGAEPPRGIATVADLDELITASREPGITVGSHTWSHANLATLDRQQQSSEMVRAREWIWSNFEESGRSDWVAYPYGLVGRDTHLVAREAGHAGGLLADGGYAKARSDPFLTNRLNVPAGVSQEGFEIRLSGLRA
jgi:peptidoglycan/xylan/chitin deacetylase (PgdA/CDA1 family)